MLQSKIGPSSVSTRGEDFAELDNKEKMNTFEFMNKSVEVLALRVKNIQDKIDTTKEMLNNQTKEIRNQVHKTTTTFV